MLYTPDQFELKGWGMGWDRGGEGGEKRGEETEGRKGRRGEGRDGKGGDTFEILKNTLSCCPVVGCTKCAPIE